MKEEFEVCSSVTTMTIPSTLKSFIPGKFSVDRGRHYNSMTGPLYEGDHVNFPKQLPNLRYFNVDANNQYLTEWHNQMILSKDKSTLLCCPPGASDPTAVVFTGIKSFGSYAFLGCQLKKLIVPASLESVDDNAFSGFSSLVEFTNATSNPDTKYQVYDGVLFEFNKDNYGKYTKPSSLICFPDGKKVERGYTITTNETYGSPSSIAPFAFDDVMVQNVIFPKAVSETTIGRCAFYNSTINTFSTKNPIYKIEADAFLDATSFYSFDCRGTEFGDGVCVMRIMPYAFWNSKLTLFSFPSREWMSSTPQLYIDISDYAFYNSKGLASFDIPRLDDRGGAVIRTLGKYCFAGCTQLASFDFRGRKLSSGTTYTDLLNIPEGAFASCLNLQAVYFDDNVVQTVGDYAFANDQLAFWCFSNQKESITSIGKYSFAKNVVANVGIPVQSDQTKSNNFHGDQFNIGDFSSLTSIDEGAFIGCKIDNFRSFYKPTNGNCLVKKVAPFVFANNELTEIRLKPGVEEIGSCAFVDNPDLTKIYLTPTISKITWNDSRLGVGHINYMGPCYNKNLQYIFMDNEQYGSAGNGVLYDKKTKTVIHCAENFRAAFYGVGKPAKGLILEDIVPGITSIAENAFAYNQNFENIVLPSTLETIGEAAFAHAQNLKSLTIPAKVTEIGKEPLYGCKAIKDVFFMPVDPPTIDNAFYRPLALGDALNIYFKKSSESKYLAYKDVIHPTTGGDYTYKIPIPSTVTKKYQYFSVCRDFDINCGETNLAVYAIYDYNNSNNVKSRSLKRYVPSRIGPNHDKYVGVIMARYTEPGQDTYKEDGNWYRIGEQDYASSKQNTRSDEQYLGPNFEYNWLVGCPIPTYVQLRIKNQYALKYNEDKKVSRWAQYSAPGVVPMNKAYLDLTGHEYPSSTQAKELGIIFDDEEENTATDIDEPIVDVNEAEGNQKAVYYNLNGVKVENPTKGIYVRNGKKVVIK